MAMISFDNGEPDRVSFKSYIFFILLMAAACLPIWCVAYYINQDGPSHAYVAKVMIELVKGNPRFNELYQFNPIPVPNLSGHWLLAFLLLFLDPFIATKVMVMLTFVAPVAAVGWLRYQTCGIRGLKTTMLYATVLGFNYLWLYGFYNFLLGVAGYIFVLGLAYRWRDGMNARRTVMLAILLVAVYFSHIFCFLAATGSIILLAVFGESKNVFRTLLCFGSAILPELPLMVVYYVFQENHGSFFAGRDTMTDWASPSLWWSQIRSADPFFILKQGSFPFVEDASPIWEYFIPVTGIIVSVVLLLPPRGNSTFLSKKDKIVFGFLFAGLLLAALLAPDSMGELQGSIIRPRFLLLAFSVAVPLFHFEKWSLGSTVATILLTALAAFQMTAHWEYAINMSELTNGVAAASTKLDDGDSVASLMARGGHEGRYWTAPMMHAGNFLGWDKDVVVRDVYEFKYTMFPVIAKTPEVREESARFQLAGNYMASDPDFSIIMDTLGPSLEKDHSNINVIMVWGDNEHIRKLLQDLYGPEPFFSSDRVRLYRHK